MDLVLLGMSIGMANALLAVGIVLIFMSSRVINMAHGEFGAFTVGVLLSLTRVAHLNYWLALCLSLLATGALAAIVERTVIARLFGSPRLILLIATVGVAQLIIVGRLVLPKPGLGGDQKLLLGGANIFPIPFSSPTIHFDRVVLLPQHLMALVVGPLLAVALSAFMRWSPYGIALRASAENAPRARLLGLPVRRISTMAWVVSAVFAGIGAVLLAPIIGFSATEAVGLPILMRGLAAATIARMESVSVAFGVGLSLGVADQLVFFWTGRSGLTDLVLLVAIVVVLLSRRTTARRTIAAEESSWDQAAVIRELPPEVARHPRWLAFTQTTLVASGAAAVIAPLVLKSAATFFLAAVFLIGAVIVSTTVLTGWAGQLSLGQWALAGLGGMAAGRLIADWHVPFFLAFAIAAVIGGVGALVLGLPALRLEGTGLAVVTLGFAVTSASWLTTQSWTTPDHPLIAPGWLTTDVLYIVSLVFLIAVVFGVRRLQRTRVGRDIVASRDNPRQAASYGVDVARSKLTAFVISGTVAGASGFLWSVAVGQTGSSAFPPVRSFSVVAAAVIGGLGSVPGAVLGAAYMWGIPYFTASVSPFMGLIATGGGLLALLLFVPGGLSQMVVLGRDWLARRITGVDPATGELVER